MKGLSALRDDEQLRRRLGQAGRTVVENEYSLSIAAPRLAALLRDAAEA